MSKRHTELLSYSVTLSSKVLFARWSWCRTRGRSLLGPGLRDLEHKLIVGYIQGITLSAAFRRKNPRRSSMVGRTALDTRRFGGIRDNPPVVSLLLAEPLQDVSGKSSQCLS
ncbi:hypothetical protein SLA2020_452080 [Shorea laevis]